MTVLLVRVGADQSAGGGHWNGPVDTRTNQFVYVAIPEGADTHAGLEKPYTLATPALEAFGVSLPGHLRGGHMHLDPDFNHRTYGDSGRKARQIAGVLKPGDRTVFYAGLRDVRGADRLVYAIIGVLKVDRVMRAVDLAPNERDLNAHGRRVLPPDAEDVIVRGTRGGSGRLDRCIPIGEYRDGAYRVRRDLLDAWGGLSAKDGYLQRSARIPHLLDPQRFLAWLDRQAPQLLQANN